jgi:type II secretory pathway pseudopilin PulG
MAFSTGRRDQKGFGLLSVLFAVLISTLLATALAGRISRDIQSAAAVSTGKYMIAVRSAVIVSLERYEAAFSLTDTTKAPAGTYPTAPAWVAFTGDSTTVSVKDLKDAGLLGADFPGTPPLGRSVHIKFFRNTADCPGFGCETKAFIYTCWPISAARPSGVVDPQTCIPAPAGLQVDGTLSGDVVSAAGGYGGSNTMSADKVRGTLFNRPTSDLDLPANSPGHAVVIASLNDVDHFGYVRMGDIRPVNLNNTLSVEGQISSNTGLLLNTTYQPGSACTVEGQYATSNRSSPVICTGGSWFEYTNHTVMGTQVLANGAAVTPPVCPGTNMEPFSYASLVKLDATMTGTDINVRGNLAGSVAGTGYVNQSGAVNVTGSFNGTVTSMPDSSIRTAQGVSVDSGIVNITPADPNARALVIVGCRYRS